MQSVSKSDSTGGESLGDVLRVDGNAAGGMLGELFSTDMTAARARCGSCGSTSIVGALLVYAHGMGMVARCPGCTAVIMRMARTPTHIWFEATGATSFAIET
jgi:hypothetical protein